MSSQTTGLCLLAVAGTLLWSAWALVIAGVLLLVVPEVVELVQQRRAYSRARESFEKAQGDRAVAVVGAS